MSESEPVPVETLSIRRGSVEPSDRTPASEAPLNCVPATDCELCATPTSCDPLSWRPVSGLRSSSLPLKDTASRERPLSDWPFSLLPLSLLPLSLLPLLATTASLRDECASSGASAPPQAARATKRRRPGMIERMWVPFRSRSGWYGEQASCLRGKGY